VRLAFAVAAHLESEILIVDEVLAVGDAEFQKKCLGKMGDISKGEGRTVLFVSHNMAAVQSLCSKGILLENGRVSNNGIIDKVVEKYLSNNQSNIVYENIEDTKINFIQKVFLSSKEESRIENFFINREELFLNFVLNINNYKGLKFGVTLYSINNVPILSFPFQNEILDNGKYNFKIKIPVYLLKGGIYNIEAALWKSGEIFDSNDCYISFEIIGDSNLEKSGEGIKGLLLNQEKWEVTTI
jgi:lipopolysaccharide transport system ATP-binding protein